jgi:DNA repair photolyase
LPTIQPLGTQSDIRYYDTVARGLLNTPEATGMGFWSINPYVGCAFGCAYCYARYTHRYVAERAVAAGPTSPLGDQLTELPSWLAFERRIFVKRNAAEVLRATLQSGRPRSAEGAGRRGHRLTRLWQGEPIAIGTATDPYQPAERTYRVTRGILEVLAAERGLSIGITTKSPLVTRDVDVLARLAVRSRLTVHISLITLDRDLARRIEPRAPTPEARVRAVRRLREAGIDTGINIMPVLPGITDRPEMLDALVRAVAEAGATRIHACALRLQATARQRYLPFIAQEFPVLAPRYRGAYAEGYQMPDRYREGLRRFLSERCREYGIRYGSNERMNEPMNELRTDAGWPNEQLTLSLGGPG